MTYVAQTFASYLDIKIGDKQQYMESVLGCRKVKKRNALGQLPRHTKNMIALSHSRVIRHMAKLLRKWVLL